MSCNNHVLKQLGLLQGVYGAEIDRIDGKISVYHTEETSEEAIRKKLDELGWRAVSEEHECNRY